MGSVINYGGLRHLQLKDASGMLEWMGDKAISECFSRDFSSYTKNDVEEFIANSTTDNHSTHFAIVDSNDEYLGTISLKNIDSIRGDAEYAISTRKKVHGTGVASIATRELLNMAFYRLKLNRVYLNVKKTNGRAIKFYEKMGFKPYDPSCNHPEFKDEQLEGIVWYSIVNEG